VAPSERKGAISAVFQNNSMLALRSKGYSKAYGFYWADNIQALACTRRTNQWKEVRAFRVSRFLTFEKVVPLREDPVIPTKQPSWLKNMLVRLKRGFAHGRTVDESENRV
jgi:hypothetical protein